MKYYTISQFSKLVGKSMPTLRNWDNNGKFKPDHVSEGGHRYYSDEQINKVLQRAVEQKSKKIIGYARVSSKKQKDDLERQTENIRTYMIAKGYSFEIITDIGSGINYNKKGLNQLIDMITNGEVERIVILCINKEGKVGENRYKFIKTKNIKKTEKEIKLIQRRLKNIRLNHIHQSTNKIVKTKPSRIVVEDLNVTGMMKNRHLSKAIQEQSFHKFITILKYKCEWFSIEFEKADRFYPSSKTCSCCGAIKKDLRLKDRVFICPECGITVDRDKNASINLSRYIKSA